MGEVIHIPSDRFTERRAGSVSEEAFDRFRRPDEVAEGERPRIVVSNTEVESSRRHDPKLRVIATEKDARREVSRQRVREGFKDLLHIP